MAKPNILQIGFQEGQECKPYFWTQVKNRAAPEFFFLEEQELIHNLARNQVPFIIFSRSKLRRDMFIWKNYNAQYYVNDLAACSPVFLPARVVQALNLNVNELGLHISRRQGQFSFEDAFGITICKSYSNICQPKFFRIFF